MMDQRGEFIAGLGSATASPRPRKTSCGGPTVPELVAALKGDYAKIDRMTVNAWDDPAFVAAVKKTGRSHLIFAGVATQVCAAYPAYSALDAGYQSYVVMDASGAFSLAEREAGIARMVQRGVILTDYFAITVEMMRSNADPRANEVYAALDMDFAVLVGQISKADAAKA
jgi:nicotinamidase-related amidase